MIKRLAAVYALVLAAMLPAFTANPELISGNLKLVVYADSGRFTLYKLSPVGKNRFEPLFDDRNGSSTSWFSVLSNGRIFNLMPRAGRKPEVISEDASIRVVFTPSDDFQVVQRYSFGGFAADNTQSLTIITTVENTSGKPGDFAVKALIDTNLGENAGIHYRTNLKDRISSETRLIPSESMDSWIVSSGKDASLMFPFASWSPVPETVFVANWERLKTLSWAPSISEGRSFNTIYSVNDSALLFLWPTQTLGANKTLTVKMSIGDQERLSLNQLPPAASAAETIPNLDRSGSRNEVIERILTRIAEIEQNPGSASDTELLELNELLDTYLSETGAP